MPAHRLLALHATRLTAYRWQPAGPREEAGFAANETGLLEFRDYLGRNADSVFYLLADIAEEGFQVEDVPYVQGGDHQDLIKRKLNQYYYGTPLSLALSRGRLKKGRRDERILFAGLTGIGQIDPWLQVMRQSETRLVGIHSAPFVIAELLGALPVVKTEQCLVMSASDAGLRQSFFENGQLRFSRLTPMATDESDQLATACAREAGKIYQYLAGQRLISRDAPLQTVALAHPAQYDALARNFPDTPERQVHVVDITTLARQHGLAEIPADSRGDRLYLHLLVTRTPRHQFAPPGETRFFRLWRIRHALNIAAGLAFVVCALVAGSQLLRLGAIAEQNTQAGLDIDAGERRYNDLMRGLPPIDISREDLKALTDRYRTLMRRSPGPEPLLRHLGQGLDRSPKIELARVDWRLGDGGAADAKVTPGQGRTTAGGASHAVLDVQARLPVAMAADHREQLAAVEAFAESLRGKDVQVQVLSLPFEQESGKALRSADASGPIEPPRLTLRVTGAL